MSRTTQLLAALALICCIGADRKEGAGRDAERIRGTWTFVSNTVEGRDASFPADFRVVISADTIEVGSEAAKPQDRTGFRYTLDSSKSPGEMEWLVELDPGHPIRQAVIYLLEGDTLKIASTAAGKPRPVDFVSRKGDLGGVWVLKRVAATAIAKPAAK
jgi:uncharacterized protein (TIGR03067 family)